MTSRSWKSIASRLITGGLIVGLVALLMWSLTTHDPTSSVAQQPRAEANEPEVEADRPTFMAGRIDEQQYLKLRGEYFAERRGLPYGSLDEPRGLALRIMDQQIAAQQAAQQPQAATASQWNPIGPAPIPNGQTSNRTDPVSGRTIAIAVHPTNPNIVYVGTANGGLYRTLDGGTTWTPLMDAADSLSIGAIAIAPSNPDIVYVGTGESGQSCDSYIGVGVYRIDNASTTATLTGPINPLVTTGIAGTRAFNAVAISEILVNPTNAANIFVSTTSAQAGIGCSYPPFNTVPQQSLVGLYRSTNATAVGAIDFTKITVTTAGSVAPDTSGNREISDLAMEPGNPNVILAWVMGSTAANDGGVWRTANALAATPTFSRTQATSLGFARGELAINKVGSTVNVVAATEEGSAGILRKSTDGGVTWPTAISALGAPGAGFCSGQCWYDIAVAMDPANANLIYLGGSANGTNGSVYVRSTNGTSFVRSETGLHADMHALAVAPSNSTIVYAGNDGGIWRSSDSGATWVSKNNGSFSATQFQSVAVHPTDRNFLIGGTQDNGTQWKKADGSWFRADFGDGGYALIDQNATDTTNVTMYHTYFNQAGGLLGFARVITTGCASDNGSISNWAFRGAGYVDGTIGCGNVAVAANNGIGLFDSAVLFYAPMALGPGNPNTVYYATDRLYRSTNRGDTMTAVSQQFANGVPVTTIGISPQDDNVRIVGTRDGKIYRTMTGGNPLTDVTSASFPTNPGSATRRFVGRAVIDPNNVNTAYVTFAYYAPAGQGVWKTTNLNAATPTWTASGNGMPSVPVNAFAIDPADSNVLFAGTDIGVYQSTDGGANWAPFNSGLPRVPVFDLVFQQANRVLRAATHGRGIYEYAFVAQRFVYLPLVVNNYTAPATLPTLQNADFDLGHVAWTESSTNFPGPESLLYLGSTGGAPAAYSGTWLAWLGGADNEVSDLSQQITVPNGTGPFYLYFRYQIGSDETNCSQVTPSDTFTLRIDNTQVDGIVVCNAFNTGANWVEFSFVPDFSAYAGQTITLHLRLTNNASLNSNVFLDSLHFSSTPPAMKPQVGGWRSLPITTEAKNGEQSVRSTHK
ncbi:MAG: hypothetical protein U0559_13085 [Anaerolineae bacterium]